MQYQRHGGIEGTFAATAGSGGRSGFRFGGTLLGFACLRLRVGQTLFERFDTPLVRLLHLLYILADFRQLGILRQRCAGKRERYCDRNQIAFEQEVLL